MQSLLRPMLLMTLILLAPVVPFVIWGRQFEQVVNEWMGQRTGAVTTASLVVGLLATDILLPVPSSVVSTIGGARLGWFWGTAASWFGMSLGAAIGFALARRWGRVVALWFTHEAELDRMQVAAEQWGTFVLVVARGVPVIAEASVLLFGLHRIPWRQFLPPVLLSNLGIALAYAAFGDWAHQHSWLPMALGFSLALPVVIAAFAQRYLRRSQLESPPDGDETAAPDRSDSKISTARETFPE